MIATTRASLSSKLVLLLACAALAALIPATAATAAEGTIVYKHESLPAYEKQLSSGQVQEITINKKVRSVHVTLKSGEHLLAKYAAHEEPKVAAAAQAKGVPVTIESAKQAGTEAKKATVHHKLRYIAGGILIVVVVVVGIVLYVDRKRKTQRD